MRIGRSLHDMQRQLSDSGDDLLAVVENNQCGFVAQKVDDCGKGVPCLRNKAECAGDRRRDVCAVLDRRQIHEVRRRLEMRPQQMDDGDSESCFANPCRAGNGDELPFDEISSNAADAGGAAEYRAALFG